MRWVTAIELAKAAGVNPKVFRSALRKAGPGWHQRYERWRVPDGSREHQEMVDVLSCLMIR